MKILFDHQIFSMQQYGGVSRYFSYLIEYCEQDPETEYILGYVYSKNEYTKKFANPLQRAMVMLKGKPEKNLRLFLNKRRSQYLIQKGEYDIFHPTYYKPSFLQFIKGAKVVITVHDMIPERFPEYFPRANKVIKNKLDIVKRADKVIAISENTKKDLIQYIPIPEEKVSVIHHGVGKMELPEKKGPSSIPQYFILFVGARSGYKNFTTLVKAMSQLPKCDDNVKLLCCGGGKFRAKEKAMIANFHLSDRIIHLGNITDSFLAYLYANAMFFVFPSFYEGFGMPILEALYYGCPVLLSDIPVFHEVAGSWADFFDPASEESLKNGIALMMTKKAGIKMEVKTELTDRFSWQKTFDRTKAVYQSVL